MRMRRLSGINASKLGKNRYVKTRPIGRVFCCFKGENLWAAGGEGGEEGGDVEEIVLAVVCEVCDWVVGC